jgi:hypothetical protein
MKRIAFISSILILLFMSACSPAKEEAPAAAAAPGPAAEAPAASVPQGPLSKNYLEAAQALYLEDFDKAKQSLTALAAESTGEFQTLAQATAGTKDINEMRQSFKALSDVASKMELPAEYAIASCPMFKPGMPSRWVQKRGDLMNPYYGKSAAMATCGSFVN